jgi:hypothetical protein
MGALAWHASQLVAVNGARVPSRTGARGLLWGDPKNLP